MYNKLAHHPRHPPPGDKTNAEFLLKHMLKGNYSKPTSYPSEYLN